MSPQLKVALVTTSPATRSGIGDYTRHLLPYLEQHCSVEVFVEPGGQGTGWDGRATRSAQDLDPGRFDRVLYQLGNEQSHAFMLPMLRALGGIAVQHDWVLFDLATAAYPGLARGGWKGHLLALREGGLQQARIYAQNRRARRRARLEGEPVPELREVRGELLYGWHAAEEWGRWCADHALARLPARGVRSLRLEYSSVSGRRLRLSLDGQLLTQRRVGHANAKSELGAEFEPVDEPLVELCTQGIRPSAEQLRRGDSRRLGTFVHRFEWRDSSGWHDLDLRTGVALPMQGYELSRDRFHLPLNRAVVQRADGFIVHSEYVAERIRAERGLTTPIGLVPHGSERRWSSASRKQLRAQLGLPAHWQTGFLVTSFGGVQPHKRIDKLFAALALARQSRPDIHLVLAGNLHSSAWDPKGTAQRLGLRESVHFTGYVPENEGWLWLEAADVSVNLRGPTTGGSSGGIFQSFSTGRAVIVSDAGEQRELPDGCVVKIPLEGEEVPYLASVLVALRDDPARVAWMEENVRHFVGNSCHWSHCARLYAEHLAQLPPLRR